MYKSRITDMEEMKNYTCVYGVLLFHISYAARLVFAVHAVLYQINAEEMKI